MRLAIYASHSLVRIRSMTAGKERTAEWNQLWHWWKHAAPRLMPTGDWLPPKIAGLPSDEEYLNLARSICQAAANGEPGTEVKIREAGREDGPSRIEWAIWYQPPTIENGLFLKVLSAGPFGELKTMFPPDDGKAYFDREPGEVVH